MLHLPEMGISEAISGDKLNPTATAPTPNPYAIGTDVPAQYYPDAGGTNVTTGGSSTVSNGPTAAQLAQIANFGALHQNILSSATDAGANAAQNQYGVGVLDFLNSAKTGQNQLNQKGTQLELARQQGAQGIRGMVGRGIQSGGVLLNNKNAGDSSAAGAIARAYGDLGQRQMSTVGNQYAQGQSELGNEQAAFNDQQNLGVIKLGAQKNQIVNSIVDQANQSLAALDGQMATAGIGDRINLEAEKQNIKSQALAQLRQYDEMLANGVAGQHPATVDQNRDAAGQLAQNGTAATNPFQFTDQAPAQFQNTGPFSGNLPLFTFGRNKQQA
jgi:hypothetical protein